MLLDTSRLFVYLSANDNHHARAVELLQSSHQFITHWGILSELVALTQARGLDRKITLEFISAIIHSREITVVWLTEADHRLALDLLKNRLDKSYSLCDALSFGLMNRSGVRQALTTDRHFEQEGFERMLLP